MTYIGFGMLRIKAERLSAIMRMSMNIYLAPESVGKTA